MMTDPNAVGKINAEEKLVKVRGLLWCGSTNFNKVSKFVNRQEKYGLSMEDSF